MERSQIEQLHLLTCSKDYLGGSYETELRKKERYISRMIGDVFHGPRSSLGKDVFESSQRG